MGSVEREVSTKTPLISLNLHFSISGACRHIVRAHCCTSFASANVIGHLRASQILLLSRETDEVVAIKPFSAPSKWTSDQKALTVPMPTAFLYRLHCSSIRGAPVFDSLSVQTLTSIPPSLVPAPSSTSYPCRWKNSVVRRSKLRQWIFPISSPFCAR